MPELADLFRRPSGEIDPPSDWQRGEKFYIRSGEFSLVLVTDIGPIGAALEFIGRAIRNGHLSELGDFIEVSESGSFELADIVCRRQTCRFLSRKFGIGSELLFHLVAKEINPFDFY